MFPFTYSGYLVLYFQSQGVCFSSNKVRKKIAFRDIVNIPSPNLESGQRYAANSKVTHLSAYDYST